MNLTTLFQTAYTVCFILAGVLFATAVFVFFRFNILDVIGGLSGIKMPGKKGGSTKKPAVTAVSVRQGKKTGKPEQVFSTGAITESGPVPRVESSAGNTVWMDTRGTGCLEETGTDVFGATGELDSTTGTLDDAGFVGGEEALAKAKAAIRFMPEKTVVVIHTEERI